jgi:hypothetical protein
MKTVLNSQLLHATVFSLLRQSPNWQVRMFIIFLKPPFTAKMQNVKICFS